MSAPNGENQAKRCAELYHDASSFYYADYWGLKKRPTTSASSAGQLEEELCFVTALCNVAGADGVASAPERDYIKGSSLVKAYLPEVVEKIDTLCDECEHKTMERIGRDAAEAMSVGTLRFSAPVIVHQAMKAAARDGIAEREMAAIHVIAENMGVSKELVGKIKELVEEEEALKRKRIAVLVPNGHPCLADEYKDLVGTNGKE